MSNSKWGAFVLLASLMACGGGGGSNTDTNLNHLLNGTYLASAFGNDPNPWVGRDLVFFTGNGAGARIGIGDTNVDEDTGGVPLFPTASTSITYAIDSAGLFTSGTDKGFVTSDGSRFLSVDTSSISKLSIRIGLKDAPGATLTGQWMFVGFVHGGATTSSSVGTVDWDVPNPGEATTTIIHDSSGGSGSVYEYTLDGDGYYHDAVGSGDTSGNVNGDFLVLSDALTTQSLNEENEKFSLKVGVKVPGSGMTIASLNGTYIVASVKWDNDLGVAYRKLSTVVFLNGVATATPIEQSGSDSSTAFTYTIDSDGTYKEGGITLGVVSADGSVVIMADADITDDDIDLKVGFRK